MRIVHDKGLAPIALSLGLMFLYSAALPALSKDLPQADVPLACKRGAMKETKGTFEERYVVCFDSEQAAYDWLKGVWNSLSDNWQEQCDREGNWASPTYYRSARLCVEARFAERDEYERQRRKVEAAEPVMPKKEFRY